MVKSFALSQLDADCARSVGLQPDQLSVDETEFLSFHEIIIQPNLQSYLCCRNYLIRTFVENSNEFVDVEQGLTMEIQQINKENPNILITARDFLDRYRYINYGLLKMPSTTDWKNVSPKRITVIGAGLAGIVAAREIHNLFTNCRIKTDITVLDRRQRLGGKHFTFPLSSNFEENGQPCVDLGSKKIYGAIGFTLDRGRMSQIISQLGLEKMKISKPDHRLFRLYDIDGSLIHADVIRGAQEFLYGVMERASTVHIYEIEELLQKHELYPLLHDTHIRILQWLLADLEADLADGNDATGCSPRIILPGGSGQIIHGLAYGLNEDDNPFRILARKEVTNLNFENNDSVLVGFGSKDFIEADAVVLAISEHELIVKTVS